MLLEIILLALLTLLASAVGTLSGFGTSTIMVPALLIFFPLPATLLFVGVIHWFGDIWKMMFFRSGVRWRLILLFGTSGLVASYLGASLVIMAPTDILARLLGSWLLLYVGWLILKPTWKLPEGRLTALTSGAFSGFLAGVFGVGGAVRGAALAAYNLPKVVYLFTNGAIAFVIDSTRLITYVGVGISLPPLLIWALVLCLPASLVGAYGAKRLVDVIPQRYWRTMISVFLALVALKLLIWT